MERASSRQIKEAIAEEAEDLSEHTIGKPGDHIFIESVEETGCTYRVGSNTVFLGDEHIEPFVRMLMERANIIDLEIEI